MRCCSLENHDATEQHLSLDAPWAEIIEGRMQKLVPLTDTLFMILWFPSSGLASLLLHANHNTLSASLSNGVEVVTTWCKLRTGYYPAALRTHGESFSADLK